MMEFEMIDALCTKGMNDAEKLCRKIKWEQLNGLQRLQPLVTALRHGQHFCTPEKASKLILVWSVN